MHRSILTLVALMGLATLAGCASKATTRPYNPVAYRPQNPANVRVKVSLANQNVYVMEGDRVLLAAATCVGTPEKPTPRGNFKVYNKIAKKRSGSYGFRVQGDRVIPAKSSAPISGRYVGYPMAYWCEFSPAYGFHSGYVHPIPKTHGCLRLHKTVAPKFYELVRMGTPVNVAMTQPEDGTIGRAIQRPQDFRDPDPPNSFLISDQVFQSPSGSLLADQ